MRRSGAPRPPTRAPIAVFSCVPPVVDGNRGRDRSRAAPPPFFWTRPIPPGPGVIVRSEARPSRTLEVDVANDPHLRVSHVTKRFGGVTAVDDVSFDVPKGAFATLLGPSGCGKTTTLRMIAGFYDPDVGDIEIGGRRVNELPAPPRGTAMVFQDYALFPPMTRRDKVAYGPRVAHRSANESQRRMHDTLPVV